MSRANSHRSRPTRSRCRRSPLCARLVTDGVVRGFLRLCFRRDDRCVRVFGRRSASHEGQPFPRQWRCHMFVVPWRHREFRSLPFSSSIWLSARIHNVLLTACPCFGPIRSSSSSSSPSERRCVAEIVFCVASSFPFEEQAKPRAIAPQACDINCRIDVGDRLDGFI